MTQRRDRPAFNTAILLVVAALFVLAVLLEPYLR